MNAMCLNRTKSSYVRTGAGDVFRTRKKLIDSIGRILRRSFPSFRFDLQCSKEVNPYGVQGKWWIVEVVVDWHERFCVHQCEWPGHHDSHFLRAILKERMAKFM